MTKPASKPAKQAPLKKISEQMREWSALLEQEVLTWPRTSLKKMFGMNAVYRGDLIFAALPSTRVPMAEDTFIFKLEQPSSSLQEKLQADSRVFAEFGIGTRWYGFRMNSGDDLHGAIEWLSHAYEAATKIKRPKVKKKKSTLITRS
jgi:hypothetical protein